MDEQLYTVPVMDLNQINNATQQISLQSLEAGKVVYFPAYFFNFPSVNNLLTEAILDGKRKNISFDYRTKDLSGVKKQGPNSFKLKIELTEFMQQYANFARVLVNTLLPQYRSHLQWGRTSYRPAQILGRSTSKRKDDTRLHVDSFAATPVNGLRILRVFCNINPFGEPRVWHLGEPFEQVMQRFAKQIPNYRASTAKLLKLIKVTKTLRSAYDHYQLQLHDRMKLDESYQQTVKKTSFDFAAQSTWLVFTDHVSHAALSGQFLLEQTFYLPVAAMAKPDLSPLKYWEREKSAQLATL
ncbi:Kdo hydroxylase family protein [Legionella gresilensis]|uniref:Kdo hydroxylase family protein n=1 Tax=Legionella gresilensis TaxID=91823 RepID=UPI0010415432|nr:Kdo hydroxylase family protein [Legionella gresilensis]